jgi:protein phosphatase
MRIGRAAGVSDTGRRRLRNEDAFVCEPPLFAVADGMGGARAGEIAARLAASALEETGATPRDEAGVAALIEEANRRIFARSVADPTTAGMGTTVTVALVDVDAETVTLGHVGDSRAYRIRDGQLEQLTTDHSLVAELVESGLLTPEEAEHHPQRSAITRALGTEESVDVDTFTVSGRPGDLFLLCSDGLSSMLAEEDLVATVVAAGLDPAEAGEALVAGANERGGEDNITVVLFELLADEDGAPVERSPEPEDIIQPSPEATEQVSAAPEPAGPSPTRHGAGRGGRWSALALIVLAVAIAVLVVLWGVMR